MLLPRLAPEWLEPATDEPPHECLQLRPSGLHPRAGRLGLKARPRPARARLPKWSEHGHAWSPLARSPCQPSITVLFGQTGAQCDQLMVRHCPCNGRSRVVRWPTPVRVLRCETAAFLRRFIEV